MTDQQKADEESRRREVSELARRAIAEQFRAISSIMDAVNVVVYVADLKTYELLYVNRYTAGLFGEDAVGNPCYGVFQAGQCGPCSFCTNDRLVSDGIPGPPYIWEFQNTRNKRWYLCIDKAMRWLDGRLVRMEVAADITERKEIESFRSQYAMLLSHDLRNPLSSIWLKADSLYEELEEEDRHELACQARSIEGLALRMRSMLEDLLEVGRLESARLKLSCEVIDLGLLARRVVERSDSARGRIRLVPLSPGIQVRADAERLERAVENLLSNALKYSPASAAVDVGLSASATEAVLSVADRGRGIAPADVPNLFQRFSRASSACGVRGLGLGLYISRLIVEAHGGRIWVETKVDEGSTFLLGRLC